MRPLHRRPTPPGRILMQHYLAPRGVTITALAAAVDVSRKHMSMIVNGHVRVEPDVAARMAKVLNTTTEFWINLQAAIDAFDAERLSAAWKPGRIFLEPVRRPKAASGIVRRRGQTPFR